MTDEWAILFLWLLLAVLTALLARGIVGAW